MLTVSLNAARRVTWTAMLAASAGSGLAGATGTIVFEFLDADATGTLWNFRYAVDNTSIATGTGSELSAFGFNTSATPSSARAASGIFAAGVNKGTFNGLGSRSVCLYAGSDGTGAADGGVGAADAPATGTFSLGFRTGTRTLVLNDFVARWQSTGADRRGSASGPVGIAPAVPEPASWATTLFGFAVVGWSMCRHPLVCRHRPALV